MLGEPCENGPDLLAVRRFPVATRFRCALPGGRTGSRHSEAFEILLLLVEHAGGVVSKQQMLDNVWHGSFVEETNLTKNIWILRNLLSDGFPGLEVIETIRSAGIDLSYRSSPENPQSRRRTPNPSRFFQPRSPLLLDLASAAEGCRLWGFCSRRQSAYGICGP